MKVVGLVCLLLVAWRAIHGAEVRGTVRSAANTSLADAVVTLSSQIASPAFATAKVDANGSFVVRTDRLGSMTLTIALPNHAPCVQELFFAAPDHVVDIDATLATNRPTRAIRSVKIVGDFNDWSFQDARPMRQEANGTFQLPIPVRGTSVVYQVLVDEESSDEQQQRSINGTHHDRLEYDGGGDFRSIVLTNEATVTIVFDPAKIPVGTRPASFAFTVPSEAQTQALVGQARDPLSQIRARASARASNENEFYTIIVDELGPAEMESVHRQLQERLPSQQRQLLVAKGLGLIRWTNKRTAQDTVFVLDAMKQIPIDSKVWYLAVGHLVDAFGSVGHIEDGLKHLRTVTAAMGDDGADQLAWGLFNVCRGVERKRPELFALAYAELQRDFRDHPAAATARSNWDPNKKILVGKPLPDFSYTTLDTPSITISPASLRGKWVFIDLWATWCGPCIAELPTITKAWEEFRNDNIVFVSISLDQSVDKIAPFRERRFSMPWHHVFLPGVFENEAAKLFEVTGIPKPILVSPDGVITHITTGLRGTALLATLRKVLRGG